jgi:hypothetical protein
MRPRHAVPAIAVTGLFAWVVTTWMSATMSLREWIGNDVPPFARRYYDSAHADYLAGNPIKNSPEDRRPLESSPAAFSAVPTQSRAPPRGATLRGDSFGNQRALELDSDMRAEGRIDDRSRSHRRRSALSASSSAPDTAATFTERARAVRRPAASDFPTPPGGTMDPPPGCLADATVGALRALRDLATTMDGHGCAPPPSTGRGRRYAAAAAAIQMASEAPPPLPKSFFAFADPWRIEGYHCGAIRGYRQVAVFFFFFFFFFFFLLTPKTKPRKTPLFSPPADATHSPPPSTA